MPSKQKKSLPFYKLPMYKVAKGLERDASDINLKNKMGKGQLLAQVKVLEDEANDKVSFVESKEKEME